MYKVSDMVTKIRKKLGIGYKYLRYVSNLEKRTLEPQTERNPQNFSTKLSWHHRETLFS